MPFFLFLSFFPRRYGKHGIKIFWLDGSEPEYYNFPQWGQTHWQNATWHAGTFAEMGQLFTLYWTQMFADGMRAKGEQPILLPRASYAGTWRNGKGLQL